MPIRRFSIIHRLVLAIVMLLLGAADSQAQTGTLSGTVIDARTGEGLPGVNVGLEGTALGAATAERGAFTIQNVPPGTYIVSARLIGYGTVSRKIRVQRGQTLRLEVELSQQAVELSGITVIGQRGGYVADRAITATKMDLPLIETPQSVTVVTADQIRDQASPNLQETVRYTPGVRHELYGVDNRGDWVSLRGSQESTMLLDGMRLPLTGWYGVVRSEPYAYERIEVLRGPSSIIAGQNDPGGVVNLVSKRPRAEAAREVGVRLGNYTHREAHADLTGPLNTEGSWLYRLVALGKDSNTQIDHADDQRALVAPSLTWRPSARHAVTLFGEYQYDRSKNTNAFLGLEGTLQPAPNGPIPTDLFIGEPDWDRYGGTRWRVGYAAQFSLGESWQLRHQLRHDRVDGLMKSMYAAWWNGFLDENGNALSDGRYLGRQWYIYDDASRVTASDLLLQGDLHTGPVKHTLLLGVDGLIHNASQASAEGQGTPLNVYAPAYGSFPEPSLGGATPTENEIRRLGVLVQDQMKFFDRVSLRVGLRRDHVRNAVARGEAGTDGATSANLGLVCEVLPGLAPYASYSESFNPVSGTDAAGKAFKPKRGEQIEAGLKWEAQSLPVQATAAFYSLKERNRLASDPDNVGHSVQIGEARVRGIELEAKGDVASLAVLGSYTYTRARASAAAWGGDLNPDQQIEGIPEHTSSVWAVHDFGHLRLPGFMRALHGWLLLPWTTGTSIGYYLVGLLALPLLGLLITGLVVYKRFWRAYVSRPRLTLSRGARVFWGELHRLIGVWSIWFIAVIALTGLWFLTQGIFWDTQVAFEAVPPVIAREEVPTAAQGMPVTRLGLDDAVAAARTVLPDLEVKWIIPPDNAFSHVGVYGRDWFPLAGDFLAAAYINPYTGEVAASQRVENLTAVQLVDHVVDPLHYGHFGGLWSKLVWFVFGLGLSLMVLSGLLIWTKRTAKTTARLRREPKKAPHLRPNSTKQAASADVIAEK